MTLGMSLHLGLNRVDAAHYGSELALRGCHNDARDMAQLAAANGYRATTWLDANARSAAVLRYLEQAADLLQVGDHLLLTYSGHGTQMPDRSGDEPEGLDEAWVLYDRMLVDDELYTAFSRFVPGVRLLLISDSCHSGSMARRYAESGLSSTPLRGDGDSSLRFRTPAELGFAERVWTAHAARYDEALNGVPGNARERIQTALIQLSACLDDQVAADGPENGLFTSKLEQVWSHGRFGGNHRHFLEAVRREMPASQQPSYLVLGNETAAFERQRPFVLSVNNSTTQPTGVVQMQAFDSERDSWEHVRAELLQRFPNGQTIPAPLANLPAGASSLQAPDTRAASGAAIVRTYFWGFQIEISSQGLREFLATADPIAALVAALGPMTGPAAPFITIAAAFVAGALQLLRSLDRGNGVYISMSWLAPCVFLPRSVETRSAAATTATRGRSEPYEQAGDPWLRNYGGGLFGLRLEEDILWNLPVGTVRDHVTVNMNPPRFGNVYFNGWLSDDPSVGHFRLHVGVPVFGGGQVNVRMMIRDDSETRAVSVPLPTGPRALEVADIFDAVGNGTVLDGSVQNGAGKSPPSLVASVA